MNEYVTVLVDQESGDTCIIKTNKFSEEMMRLLIECYNDAEGTHWQIGFAGETTHCYATDLQNLDVGEMLGVCDEKIMRGGCPMVYVFSVTQLTRYWKDVDMHDGHQ